MVPFTRESLSCGAGVLAAAVPSLLVHTHGCLAVLQPKLETELLTLLTVFQVLSRGTTMSQVLSLVVLLVCLVRLVVALCTGGCHPAPPCTRWPPGCRQHHRRPLHHQTLQ